LENPDVEFAKAEAVIDAAISNGIYVIVDWHDHHAEDHEAQAIQFFEKVATKYGNEPNIIYEIYNEPLQISWSDVLKPYHERLIRAIRY
jgi:endoglucanase